MFIKAGEERRVNGRYYFFDGLRRAITAKAGIAAARMRRVKTGDTVQEDIWAPVDTGSGKLQRRYAARLSMAHAAPVNSFIFSKGDADNPALERSPVL